MITDISPLPQDNRAPSRRLLSRDPNWGVDPLKADRSSRAGSVCATCSVCVALLLARLSGLARSLAGLV